MSTRRVAVAGCQELADYDTDWPLLRRALASAGGEADYAFWDDQTVDWGAFDVVFVHATWDYTSRPAEFLAWAASVARVTEVRNPVEVLRWNHDKRYLADLAAGGVPVIPTVFVSPGERWSPTPTNEEYVVKPAVSAGARETARYGPKDTAAAAGHVERLLAQGKIVMVQPYQSAIDAAGETALVLVAGRFSHAARKAALLRPGEGVIDDVMSRVKMAPAEASPAELALAERVAAFVRRRFGTDPLVNRVDVVPGPDGEPVVMEAELIEPALFLELAPGSEQRLARALMGQG